jgi:enoyl-CoA hydratase/carnithine racemase
MSTADGAWARHVLTGWFEMMDMATPIIAQVHGFCLAGGTELATACDLVYVAHDAQVGYPPVRSMSSPDMAWHAWMLGMRRAMEAMLTGDSMTGDEAVASGFANRFPDSRLRFDMKLEIAQTLVSEKKFSDALPYLNELKDDAEAQRHKPAVCQLLGVVTLANAASINFMASMRPPSLAKLSAFKPNWFFR